MASRDLSDLSLDDIIKKNRTQKSGGARRSSAGGSRPVRRVGSGAIQKRNPKKWDNDKFFEVYANKKGGAGGSGSTGGKAVCRLANIPYNVTQEELETLFQKYRLAKVTLHYDFKGRSVGTAELHGNREAILRVKKDFTGVEIDGRAVDISVVGGGGGGSPSISRRVSRPGAVPSRGNGPRRGGAGGAGGRGGPKKTQKPKMTTAELDKELDEYMKGTNKMES